MSDLKKPFFCSFQEAALDCVRNRKSYAYFVAEIKSGYISPQELPPYSKWVEELDEQHVKRMWDILCRIYSSAINWNFGQPYIEHPNIRESFYFFRSLCDSSDD